MSPDEELRRAAVFDLSDDSDPPPSPAKKKAKKKSPTARTLEYARKKGWDAAVVERWNPHAKVLHDLFGCIDILALDGRDGVLAIQATSDLNAGNSGRRCEKVAAEPRAIRWLRAGGRLEVWAWRMVGKRGERKTWQVRRLKAEIVAGGIEWDEVQP